MIEKDYMEYIEKQSVEGLQKVIQRIDKNKFPEHFEYVTNKLTEKTEVDTNFINNEKSISSNKIESHTENLIAPKRIEDDTIENSSNKIINSTEDIYYKKIMYGWITGLILAAYILVVSINSLLTAGPEEDLVLIYLGFVDVFVTLLLTYGFYKRNKTSAVILLLYFSVPKVIIFLNTNDFIQLLKGLVFVYFLLQGTIAIFEYHRKQETDVNSQVAL